MPLLQISPSQYFKFDHDIYQTHTSVSTEVTTEVFEETVNEAQFSTKSSLKSGKIHAVVNSSSGDNGSRSLNQKKKVTFSDGTKTWDGLAKAESDFDELLFCFLVKGQSIGDGDILRWTQSDCHRIFNMCLLISGLIARLRKEDPCKKGIQIPCLPKGGGRAIKIERAYEPYIISLFSVLVTCLQACLLNPVRKNFELLTESNILFIEKMVENKKNLDLVIPLVEPLV